MGNLLRGRFVVEREKFLKSFFNVRCCFCGCVLMCGANMDELNPNALLEDEVE